MGDYKKVGLGLAMAITLLSSQAMGESFQERIQTQTKENITFSDRINKIKKVDATFDQKIYNESNKIIQKSSGTFKLDEQYGFNWNVSSPYSEEIIFDKDKLYIHDPDLEQVRIDNIDNNNEFLSIFFNGQDIDDKFESHLLDNNTYVVIPTQNKLGMRYLISFKNQTIDEIIMEDGVAQKTIISFDHSKQNKELEKSDFTLNVYDSLDVIRAYDY